MENNLELEEFKENRKGKICGFLLLGLIVLTGFLEGGLLDNI